MIQRHSRRQHAAFTLAELLVAMAIIGIIATVTVIAIRGIAGDARLASAKNAVTAGLDNARAIALRDNAIVLAVFRVVEVSEGGEQVTEILLTKWTGESTNEGARFYDPNTVLDRFEVIADVRPRQLPAGVKVAAPWYDVADSDEQWVTQPEFNGPGGAAENRAGRMPGLMFGPDGSVITSNVASFSNWVYIDFDQDGTQDLGTGVGSDWVYDELDDEPLIEPAPFLAVYDDEEAREFKALDWTGNDTVPANYFQELTGPQGYITSFADRIHFNRYTGVVLR